MGGPARAHPRPRGVDPHAEPGRGGVHGRSVERDPAPTVTSRSGSPGRTWIGRFALAVAAMLLALSRLEAADPLAPLSLRNAEYSSPWTPSRRVRLRDGQYRAPAAPGAATEIRVSLLDRMTAWTAGGRRYAAVILVTDPGGSGTFHDLAVVEDRRGRPVEVASAALGDRIRVESLTLALRDGQTELHVGLVGHAPHDPLCCPTRRMARAFAWDGRLLVARAAE